MFISPYFGGCKYTNNFLFINKNIEIQRLVLLITSVDTAEIALYLRRPTTYEKHESGNLRNTVDTADMSSAVHRGRRPGQPSAEIHRRDPLQESVPVGMLKPHHSSGGNRIRSIGRKEHIQGQGGGNRLRDTSGGL